MTFAAFLLPAGKFSPSLSNFSRKQRPPFLDLALSQQNSRREKLVFILHFFSCVDVSRENCTHLIDKCVG